MASVREGSRSVLLVVDVQAGVMAQTWDAPRVIANIALAVQRARAQGVPVLWVQHESDELPHGSAAWQLAEGLVPADGEARVFKRYESSFEQTGLEDRLAQLGATRIVLAGACTNWCIRATAYGALDRGYDLTLLKDAHTTGTLELGPERRVLAEQVVDDLNVVMRWIQYPGRSAGTAAAAEVAF